MVKMRLRPTRRRSDSTASGVQRQGRVMNHNSSQQHNLSSTAEGGARRGNDGNNDERISNSHQNSNRPPSASSSSTSAQKVLGIFDSPRRVLANHRRKVKKCPTSSSKVSQNSNNIKFNTNINKIPNDEMEPEGMDIDLEPTVRVSKFQVSFQSQSIMHWLHDEAPQDIIPKIISYLGPQKHLIMSRLNKSWRKICLSEGVFRTLCEDYGKWKVGVDNEPMLSFDDEMDENATFWRTFYTNNPIVPLDYTTIHKALDANGPYNETLRAHVFRHSVRLLLVPGILHAIEGSINLYMQGEATFSVETLSHSSFDIHQIKVLTTAASSDGMSFPSSPPRRRTTSKGNFRNIFSCRSIASDATVDGSASPSSYNSSLGSNETSFDLSPFHNMAIISIKTIIADEPVFHILQGDARISKIAMFHYCNGIDIWNGNTVIQVQPKLDHRNRPIDPVAGNKLPRVLIEESLLTSASGRGIVAIDGGLVKINKCTIMKCAATGIYVGGPGSSATITQSDIILNGNGNQRCRRGGIARGHSGVYLEQGIANLTNCNISNNSLSGISAISQTNAMLIVKDSDLVGNSTVQLEMPMVGSISRQRSMSTNNNISMEGEGRSRSGVFLDEGNAGVSFLSRSVETAERMLLCPNTNGNLSVPLSIMPPSIPMI